jgi:hypothetical protein
MQDDDERRRLVFRDSIAAEEAAAHEMMTHSLSFDGMKLAVCRDLRYSGGEGHAIFINGERAHDVPFETVHYFDWIDNDRLAWECWDRVALREKEDTIHYFLNGEDLTDRFDFQPVLMDRMRHAIIVTEGETQYTVFDDGSRSPPRPKRDIFSHDRDAPRPERPEERWDEARRRVRVEWRGSLGPQFDAIESASGLRSYAIDGDRIAYVGIRYGGVARAMGRSVGAALERIEGEPKGLAKLFAWPMALLFNPYFGIGHAYIEGSRRYFPVNGATPWKKGYRFAHDHFFTPKGELAVTCADPSASLRASGVRVVIDEDEGPAFDQVWNVRCLPTGEVCYLAKKGEDICRIVVRS